MIAEFIDSLRCNCPPPFRSYGFHRELAAIHARRQRWRNAWQAHEQNCHQVITDHAPGGDVALLTGAGICFDLPVETLLSRYTEIWLADVAFHISVRRLARRNPAIRLITADLTGLLATALPDILSDIRPVDLWQTEPRIDLVVSANLITQLPLPFLDNRSTPDRSDRSSNRSPPRPSGLVAILSMSDCSDSRNRSPPASPARDEMDPAIFPDIGTAG